METKPVATATARSPLFDEIIVNDNELREAKSGSVIFFTTAARLRARKIELIRAAEKSLRWNTDKGSKV